MFNDELKFEAAVVSLLQKKGWTEVLKNKTEKELLDNWANILFNNNKEIDRLNGQPLTDGEKAQLMEKIKKDRTPFALNKLINGNGGFSLRKIDAFITASKNIKKDLNNKWDWEDVLYSYWYKDKMNIAPDETSLKFGWQQNPEICYENNGKKLPFGSHKPHIFGKDFEPYKKYIG